MTTNTAYSTQDIFNACTKIRFGPEASTRLWDLASLSPTLKQEIHFANLHNHEWRYAAELYKKGHREPWKLQAIISSIGKHHELPIFQNRLTPILFQTPGRPFQEILRVANRLDYIDKIIKAVAPNLPPIYAWEHHPKSLISQDHVQKNSGLYFIAYYLRNTYNLTYEQVFPILRPCNIDNYEAHLKGLFNSPNAWQYYNYKFIKRVGNYLPQE